MEQNMWKTTRPDMGMSLFDKNNAFKHNAIETEDKTLVAIVAIPNKFHPSSSPSPLGFSGFMVHERGRQREGKSRWENGTASKQERKTWSMTSDIT
jgi:hypothetical protein